MRLPPLIHSLLVCALAAWMTLCCCEKRMLAAEILGNATASEDDCCSGAPHDDDGRDGDERASGDCCSKKHRSSDSSDHDRGCCKDDCCKKASFQAPPLHIGVDTIGVALPATNDVDAFGAALRLPTRAMFDRSDGEPPPRLGLITTARLRI